MKKHGAAQGIALKKTFGQHFLRDDILAQRIVSYVDLNQNSSVFEIGCGDGALTRMIVQCKFARLWVFEIDPEWAAYIQKRLPDPRMTVFQEDILSVNFERFEEYKPWVLLSNLPYQITFPILHILLKNRDLLSEGVIMVQEEVAKKITTTHGRGYGYISHLFQYYFDWTLKDKVHPSSFYPPPKVFSRLLHFKPKKNIQPIPDEENFWQFVKACYKQPRRTLKNNLVQKAFDMSKIPEDILVLRAQQMTINDLLKMWDMVRSYW